MTKRTDTERVEQFRETMFMAPTAGMQPAELSGILDPPNSDPAVEGFINETGGIDPIPQEMFDLLEAAESGHDQQPQPQPQVSPEFEEFVGEPSQPVRNENMMDPALKQRLDGMRAALPAHLQHLSYSEMIDYFSREFTNMYRQTTALVEGHSQRQPQRQAQPTADDGFEFVEESSQERPVQYAPNDPRRPATLADLNRSQYLGELNRIEHILSQKYGDTLKYFMADYSEYMQSLRGGINDPLKYVTSDPAHAIILTRNIIKHVQQGFEQRFGQGQQSTQRQPVQQQIVQRQPVQGQQVIQRQPAQGQPVQEQPVQGQQRKARPATPEELKKLGIQPGSARVLIVEDGKKGVINLDSEEGVWHDPRWNREWERTIGAYEGQDGDGRSGPVTGARVAPKSPSERALLALVRGAEVDPETGKLPLK